MSDNAIDDHDTRLAELIQAAQEAAGQYPELLTLLERLTALPDIDVNRHAEMFDEAHQVLRRTLAGAGRPDTPIPGT